MQQSHSPEGASESNLFPDRNARIEVSRFADKKKTKPGQAPSGPAITQETFLQALEQNMRGPIVHIITKYVDTFGTLKNFLDLHPLKGELANSIQGLLSEESYVVGKEEALMNVSKNSSGLKKIEKTPDKFLSDTNDKYDCIHLGALAEVIEPEKFSKVMDDALEALSDDGIMILTMHDDVYGSEDIIKTKNSSTHLRRYYQLTTNRVEATLNFLNSPTTGVAARSFVINHEVVMPESPSEQDEATLRGFMLQALSGKNTMNGIDGYIRLKKNCGSEPYSHRTRVIVVYKNKSQAPDEGVWKLTEEPAAPAIEVTRTETKASARALVTAEKTEVAPKAGLQPISLVKSSTARIGEVLAAIRYIEEKCDSGYGQPFYTAITSLGWSRDDWETLNGISSELEQKSPDDLIQPIFAAEIEKKKISPKRGRPSNETKTLPTKTSPSPSPVMTTQEQVGALNDQRETELPSDQTMGDIIRKNIVARVEAILGGKVNIGRDGEVTGDAQEKIRKAIEACVEYGWGQSSPGAILNIFGIKNHQLMAKKNAELRTTSLSPLEEKLLELALQEVASYLPPESSGKKRVDVPADARKVLALVLRLLKKKGGIAWKTPKSLNGIMIPHGNTLTKIMSEFIEIETRDLMPDLYAKAEAHIEKNEGKDAAPINPIVIKETISSPEPPAETAEEILLVPEETEEEPPTDEREGLRKLVDEPPADESEANREIRTLNEIIEGLRTQIEALNVKIERLSGTNERLERENSTLKRDAASRNTTAPTEEKAPPPQGSMGITFEGINITAPKGSTVVIITPPTKNADDQAQD